MLLRWTGLLRRRYTRFRCRGTPTDTTRPVDILMGAAMFMPREVFNFIGGWDEAFIFGGEDMDLSTRVGRCYAVVYHPQVEFLHHGRTSSRQHTAFAAVHIPAGFVRHLRKTGAPQWALWGYKLVVTLDAPIEFAAKVAQAVCRWLRGRPLEARSSWLAAKGWAHFLRSGLVTFWRA
jgi:GT2 family glycosyltransferase